MKGISRPDIVDRILSDGWVENIDTDNVYFYIPASDSKTDYKAIPLIAEDDDLRSVYRQSAKVISIDKTDNALTMEKITQVIEIMVEAAGVEPASENIPLQFLRTYPLICIRS